MRLAQTLGKAQAHHRVEQWSQAALREGRSLKDLVDLAVDPTLTPQTLDELFDADVAARPARALAAQQFKAWETT